MPINNPHINKVVVTAKATYYRDFVRVWIPNQPYLRYPDGFELPKHQSIATSIDSDEDSVLYETNIERSLRRTIKTIKDYVHMNDFEWFATFTFASDRHNDKRIRTRLSNWFRNQRKRNGKFRYIVVLERHKDGALHFHALIGDYGGKLPFAINPHTGNKIPDGRGDYVRNFGEYTLGINTAKKIQNTLRASMYLQKYITKENVVELGKNRYWASKNLRRPNIEENPQPYYKAIEANRHYVLDHGTILEFDKGNNPVIDTFIESQHCECGE